MEYLIQNKKCTRFGMIGGPDDNTDARERKEAFLEILQNNTLAFHPENFVTGDLSRRNTEAASIFLNQNPDIQAVFGYDNSAVASKVSPTLSSVQTNKNFQTVCRCMKHIMKNMQRSWTVQSRSS